MLKHSDPMIQSLLFATYDDDFNALTERVYAIMHEPGLTFEDRRLAVKAIVEFAKSMMPEA